MTWGQLQGMSWNFFNAYCDEAWAVLSGSDWLGGSPAMSPSGFDMAALQADLPRLGA